MAVKGIRSSTAVEKNMVRKIAEREQGTKVLSAGDHRCINFPFRAL